MSYFLINGKDFSNTVSNLTIGKTANYYAQTNANGNTVVDYINSKRRIDVSFIPLYADKLKELLVALEDFSLEITFRNPHTGLNETAHCILPDSSVDYYTIQDDKVMANPFTLSFTEL